MLDKVRCIMGGLIALSTGTGAILWLRSSAIGLVGRVKHDSSAPPTSCFTRPTRPIAELLLVLAAVFLYDMFSNG